MQVYLEAKQYGKFQKGEIYQDFFQKLLKKKKKIKKKWRRGEASKSNRKQFNSGSKRHLTVCPGNPLSCFASRWIPGINMQGC